MKTVSLITTTWNSGRTVSDTLRSINAQTWPMIEHIVVDGGSTDDTMEIVAKEGRRVASAVSEPDEGLYDAFNKGLDRATGDIIGYLNSDDYYCSPDVIASVVKAFECAETEAVYADLVYVDALEPWKVVRHWKSRTANPWNLKRGFVPAHPTLFLTRAAYEKVGRYDTRYRLAADYDFMLRAFHLHKLKSVHVPEVWVRMRAGGATGGSTNSIMRQNDEIRASQRAHGVNYPKPLFMAHKIMDRVLQMARAPYARVPDIPAVSKLGA